MSSTAPDDLAAPVRAVLSAAELADLDALGILDVLWLAATMDAAARAEPGATDQDLPGAPYQGRRRFGQSASRGRGQPAGEKVARPGEAEDPSATQVFDDYDHGAWTDAGGIAARRVTLGGESPLPGPLELARALRPLRQWSPSRRHMVLDVEATVRASAAAGHTLPVLRAGKERRFSVDLVFDVSPSMMIWRDVFAEVFSVFQHVGAFGDVKQWGLHAEGNASDVWLTDKSGRRWRPRALRGAGRRRITVIVTDAVAGHWYTPRVWRHLTDWGTRGTVALLDLLPLRLWSFSGAGRSRVRVRATSSAPANAELKFNVPRRWRLAGRSTAAAVPFPIMELSPAGLAAWSAMVASAHPAGSAALLVEANPPYGMTEAPPARSDGEVSLKNFFHTASPAALRLAVLAATSDFTTVGVLRAIQREMLPSSAVSDLAQVLVSGIYQQVPPGRGIRIRMDPWCQTELQKLASPQDRWDVVRAISTVIQRDHPASAATFQAAVRDVWGEITLPRNQRAFAEMARSALAQARAAPSREESADSVRQEERVPPPSSSTRVLPKTDPPGGSDFFISYVQADRAWAEWIAWVLEEDGHRVLVQAWDFLPGTNWIQGMQAGVSGAERTIAVLSPAYLESEYGTAEWQAAWVSDPAGVQSKLLVARVKQCDRPGLLSGVVSIDLFGTTEAEARARLRTMISAIFGRAKPATAPVFPGGRAILREPRFPEALPRVWKVPARNPNFTGRSEDLVALARALASGSTVTVQSVRGMGGVGKTQLVNEFAHAHAGDYDLVYWIAAEEPATIADQFTALAVQLGLGPVADPEILRGQVHDRLRSVPGWLLVFDNADAVEDIRAWLPSGPLPPGIPGHVIVTTRRGGFAALGQVMELDVIDLPSAVALLRARVPDLPQDAAREIAARIGTVAAGTRAGRRLPG